MAVQPGETLGVYTVQSLLGSGGMATVYKAYHAKLNRFVAIKMMHAQLLADDSFHQRFEREAQVVAQLEHPHIVPVYDYSEYQHQPYLVMKYIDGETLKARIQREALSLATIRHIMHRIANALDYAHQQGVLHRDIKPSNIVIAQDGTPYITDFGLARLVQSGESTMSADMMLGTPQYISPEQARGDKTIDHRTDLYSFAIILYELLVGRVPFSSDTAYATVHEQIYNPPPPPSHVNPEITPAVENVLLRALSKSPDDRYPSAVALMQALEDALTASNLQTLDPNRIANVVPVQHTASPIPPAVALHSDGVSLNVDAPKAKNTPIYNDMPAQSDDEEELRAFVKKKMSERQGLIIHAISYFTLNLFIHLSVLINGGIESYQEAVFGLGIMTFSWGFGVYSHYRAYNSKYGRGRDQINKTLEREIQRERERRGYKTKNDELYDYDPSARIRLTEDGELTDSYAEAQDQQYRNRQ